MLRNDSVDFLSIGQASSLLSLSTTTLRALERDSKISAYYTPGGTRRYRYRELIDQLGFTKDEPETTTGRHACYLRVSSASQKPALEKQHERMVAIVAEREGIEQNDVRIFKDCASAFGNRNSFNYLLLAITRGEVLSLTAQVEDRLARDSSIYFVKFLCKEFGIKLICLDKEEEDEDELVQGFKCFMDWVSVISNRKQARLQASRRIKKLDGSAVEKIKDFFVQGIGIDATVRYLNSHGYRVEGKSGPIPRRCVGRYVTALETTLEASELDQGNTAKIFLRANVTKKKGSTFLAREAFSKYVEWAKKNGFELHSTKQQFGKVLLELFGEHRRQYCGLANFHDLKLS